jgi:CIC family chloride channel protein
VLYGRGIGLIVLVPTAGGLTVGLLSRFVFRQREGHGIVDVMESVARSSGVIQPSSAIEKILTSGITIGSGGSAGAEGPIVQIGAAIASGIGQFFRVARPHLPVLIGCGSAAGISAIFNSPIGGLLFTLEVILHDYSVRTLTPLVIASVIANFTTAALFQRLLHENYTSIFNLPPNIINSTHGGYDLVHSPNFILLGLACGMIGVSLTRLMHFTEQRFDAMRIPRWIKPAIGGLLLGLLGLVYVLIIGRYLLGRQKFIPFEQYSMPAFFGDGYRAVQWMFTDAFYQQTGWVTLLGIMLFILVAKILGTCFTLGSGGAGGIIAPSLFLGGVTGGALGLLLQHLGLSHNLAPSAYALIGIGAVLAAVVHAPLASILILFEVTRDYSIVLPAMLTTIVSTGISQVISRDSIYTLSLRLRGIRPGEIRDISLLRRLTMEQVPLDPAPSVRAADPLQHVLDLVETTGAADFAVNESDGRYVGMLLSEDIKTALLQREAIPLLTVGEIMRADVPLVRVQDDLATVLDTFARTDAARLPVCVSRDAARVIGLVSRASLMRRYQRAIAES